MRSVTTPKGFKDAYKQMVGRRLDGDVGRSGNGRAGPAARRLDRRSWRCARPPTWPSRMYPGLTHGAYSAIQAGGSDEQKTDLPAQA